VVPTELNIARFLAPVVPAWALVNALAIVFHHRWKMYRLRFIHDHVLVCGLGRRGLELVRDFHGLGDRVVGIEVDEQNDHVRICRNLGITVLIGDANDSHMLEQAGAHRAKMVLCTAADDGQNIGIAIRNYDLTKRIGHPRTQPVQCFVHVVALKLCAMLEGYRVITQPRVGFEARIFNVYQNAARSLFYDHPLDFEAITQASHRNAELIIVGFGKMGESVALQASKIGHFANRKPLKILIVDKSPGEFLRFQTRFPCFGEICDVKFLHGELEDEDVLDDIARRAGNPDTLTSVAICLDGDTPGLFAALSILARTEELNTPIYVRMAHEGGLATMLDASLSNWKWAYRVHAFGMTSLTCTKKMLMDDKLDRLAMEIHAVYMQIRESAIPPNDPSMMPWNKLDGDLKDSCRQQADHIAVKLRAIGCYSSGKVVSDTPVAEFGEQEVEIMAIMEHSRWCAERRLAGWQPGPRQPDEHTSPYFVDYDTLPEEVRDFNRESVRRLPRLLEAVGERIYRVASSPPERTA
ncbi:MAG: NAD-binding protein, partial [bacterium]